MALTGLLTKAHSGFFTVHVAGKDGIPARDFLCQAAGRLQKTRFKEDALAVGDRVTIEEIATEGSVNGRIIAVSDRARSLSRLDPIHNTNAREIRQVIVANVDLCVFVFACANPEPKTRMLDRFLVIAERQNIPALIVINKIDLIGKTKAEKGRLPRW